MIDRLVQTAEYTVRVTKERFEMTKKAVVAMSTGEELPCVPSSRGCTGASHTYSWTVPQTMDCPLQLIRQTTMNQESGCAILVDESAQIVLEITSSVPTEVGTCPGQWLKTTEPQILIALDSSARFGYSTQWRWNRGNSFGRLETPWKSTSAGESSPRSEPQPTVTAIYRCMVSSPSLMYTLGYSAAHH